MKNRKKLSVALICAAAALILCGIVYILLFRVNPWVITLHLNGDSTAVLAYGTTYEEPGCSAEARSKWLYPNGKALPVKIEGTVGSLPGEYILTYEAAVPGNHAAAERTVIVQDSEPPVLTLLGDTEMIVTVGEEFIDPGFRAVDNADGDLTDRVSLNVTAEGAEYRVSDSSGNTAVAYRTFRRANEAPTIYLSGEAVLQQPAGFYPYVEPGFTAFDSLDGDLTDKVTVSGTVNPYRAGDYVLTYSVTDSESLTAYAERTVTVTPVPRAETKTPEGKVIYLTFDDGPSENTERLLDILAFFHVKATWFVTAKHPDYEDKIEDIVAQGHSIAVHTAYHDYNAIYASEDAYFKDFRIAQELIFLRTGIVSTLFRFPGGSSNTVSRFNPGIMTALARDAEDCGLTYFDWNVTGADTADNATRETVLENLKEGVQERDVSVVLQHDTMDFSVEALTDFIPWAQERGYEFLPLDATSPTAHHEIWN